MNYLNLHPSINGQLTHIMIDNITTLPSLFVSIYTANELKNKSSGTQENILISLRFFYIYYFKKYKVTFDYAFYKKKYNIAGFIKELNGFFDYLLDEQHLNDEIDIVSTRSKHKGIPKANKVTYGNHVRCVGGFFRYINYRYMNNAYQNMSPTEAHELNMENRETLADIISNFNSIKVLQNEPVSRYKSIKKEQNVKLTNMLIPSTPAFTDPETGEYIEEVVNPHNPFVTGFQQFRNYCMHRLMYTYGMRVGEVLLVSLDSVGETLPDSRGKTRFVLIVQNIPDDVIDPRKRPPSIKTQHSYRQIELTDDDFILFKIFIEQYRAPLFEEKGIEDHGILFIKNRGDLAPISYDGIRSIYRDKIDPTFIALYPDYRKKGPRNINYMVTLTPHVGRHTWAYITLEYIYNEILKENLMMAHDYGIRARMNGELDAAVEQLRTLGGWSVESKVPLMYANRFLEIVSNESNRKRTNQDDQYLAISEVKPPKPAPDKQATYDVLEDNGYDDESDFDDIFS